MPNDPFPTRCAKCGYDTARVTWDAALDALAVTCQRCGYAWTATPLDAVTARAAPAAASVEGPSVDPEVNLLRGMVRAVRRARDDLLAEYNALNARVVTLKAAVRWALGEEGEFAPPEMGSGLHPPPYWWRVELRARAFPPERARD